MSDRGFRQHYRHMHGFGSHTFKWVNAEGEGVWVKYHFKTEQGVKNLIVNLAAKLAVKIRIIIQRIYLMRLKKATSQHGSCAFKSCRLRMRIHTVLIHLM